MNAEVSPSDVVGDRLAKPDRVVALSDGVFAIVITLLVLEVAVPDNLAEQSLRSSLEELRPTFGAWVISFLITGMYWVMHRDLFSRIKAVNRGLVWLNLLYLLPVSLIPFAASVLGKYPDTAIALHLYGAIMITATLMRLTLNWYVVRHPALLWPEVSKDRGRLAIAIMAAPILVYVLAMVVASAMPELSILLYLAVPALYYLLVTLLRARPGTRDEADELD